MQFSDIRNLARRIVFLALRAVKKSHQYSELIPQNMLFMTLIAGVAELEAQF